MRSIVNSQFTLKCRELQQKNEKVQCLTKWCHEPEQENEQAKELKKQHHALEQKNAVLKQQVGLSNMKAEELLQQASRRSDKLEEEN